MKIKILLTALIALFAVNFAQAQTTEYVVTPSSCINTTALTTVFSATIDSNWENHKEIDFFLNIENKQNSGSPANMKVIIFIQGVADTVVNATVSNSAILGRHFVTGRIYREDSLLYVGKSTLGIVGAPTSADDFSGGTGNGAILSGVDFNSAIPVEIKVQYGTATNVTYKVISGRLTQL